LVVVWCLFVAAPMAGQKAAPGHRIFGANSDSQSLMVDSAQVVDQVWTSGYSSAWAHYVDQWGSLLRVIVTDSLPIGGSAGGLQRVALDGTVLWDYRYDQDGRLSHHDIVELPNGNVLIVAWEEKTEAEAVAAGRDPALLDGTFRPDHIIEVQQTGLTTGDIVWEWYAWDHLIQDFDPTQENFGVVGDHPELIDINYPKEIPALGDWNHINGIDYDPIHDRILLSANEQSEIWVIDHSTTTEEAAGHTGGRWGRGGDILYRWGNPLAYRAGNADDKIFRTQHSPRFIPEGYSGEGNFLVFLNNTPRQTDRSAVYELVPPLNADGSFILGPQGRFGPDGPIWSYSQPGFYSNVVSSAERLPNGNTLISSGTQNRVFEVDLAGNTVWEFDVGFGLVFNADYVERWLWADRQSLSASGGGRLDLDLIAGTPYAGMEYLLLASKSGTLPGTRLDEVTLPLNYDSLTQFAIEQQNAVVFENNAGTLDSSGRAVAAFNLPDDSPLVEGDIVHFAYFVTDPESGDAIFVSNATPVTIVK